MPGTCYTLGQMNKKMTKNKSADSVADDKKKNMPTIKHYESSDDDDDDDVVAEIFTRKPSERRSKPSFEALRDHHKDLFTRYTIPRLHKDNASDVSSTDERYVSPEKRSPPTKAGRKRGPSQKKRRVIPDGENDISSLSSSGDEAAQAAALKSEPEKVLQRKVPPADEHLPSETEMNTTIITGFTIFFEEARGIAQLKFPDANFEKLRSTIYDWYTKLDRPEREKYETRANSLQKKTRPGPLSMKKKWNEKLLESVKQEAVPVEEPSVAAQVRDIPPARKIVRCANEACNNIAIDDPRWNGDYCSTACVVQHCKDVLHNFVISRKEKRLEDEQAKINISDDIFESSDVVLVP